MPNLINSYRYSVAATFDPLTLTPAAWYDFSDGASITSSGGLISQINDKSGNGNHLVQATGGSKPTLTAAAQNGLSVATFDTDDTLEKTGFTLGQPFTIFIVAKNTTASAAAKLTITGDGSNSGYYDRQATTKYWGLYCGSQLLSTTADDLACHVHTIDATASTGTMRLDGTQIANGSVGGGAYSSNVLRIGSGGGGGWGGTVCEFLICTTPTTTLRNNYEAALKAKWGTP